MQPLLHRRILITRARDQASALATQLEALGAETILIPTIEIAPPESYAGLDAALAVLHTFDWLILTSPNAVHALAARVRRRDEQNPGAPSQTVSPSEVGRRNLKIAAIGQSTARAITESGLAPAVDLIPPQATAESLAEAMLPHAAASSMLLVRAAVARDILPTALTAAGATLTIAEAYRNVIPTGSVAALRELFATNPPDAITFTSASTAQNLVALLNSAGLTIPPTTVLASIGPITSQAMRELHLTPNLEAHEATIAALVEALCSHYQRSTTNDQLP